MSVVTYWVWLAAVPHLSAFKTARLLEAFGSPAAIYNASKQQLSEVSPLGHADISALQDKNLKPARKIIQACDRLGYKIITMQDAEYPDLLRSIDDPPAVLYCKGKLPAFDLAPGLAVVGPRNPTRYGYQVTKKLVYQLANAGLTIVSGMARGIDAAAHAAALEAGKPTVAVLGCGLDICYPAENKLLYNDIPNTGALLSEYPPGSEPAAHHFPVRNRILSGLSYGVLIPEASLKSGALITASRALDQGREVYAVPGNIDAALSAGTNQLIQNGAKPVVCADDILADIAPMYLSTVASAAAESEPLSADDDRYRTVPVPEPEPAAAADEGVAVAASAPIDLPAGGVGDIAERLYALLKYGDKHADQLIQGVGEPAEAVTTALTILELHGKIKQLPGKMFTLHGK